MAYKIATRRITGGRGPAHVLLLGLALLHFRFARRIGYDGLMPEETKIDVHEHGNMSASCNESDFAAIKQAICDRLGYTENVEHVWAIRVVDQTKLRPPKPPVIPDGVALVGCAVIGFLLLSVFVAGIGAIIKMF